jgi:hypothetical protein
MAIRALCDQTRRLDDFDVKRLGVDFSLRIAELRGQITGYKRGGGQSHGQRSDLALQFIQDIFAREVKDVLVPEYVDVSVVRQSRAGQGG